MNEVLYLYGVGKGLKNTRIKNMLIFFFSVVGVITTIKLTSIYFTANFKPYAMPSFCSINSTIDCDGIARTSFSQFLGIPLAIWGLGFYLCIIFLLFVDKLKKHKFLSILNAFKNPADYITALGYIAFTISMLLAGTSAFVIKKVCVLCVATYFIDLIIALLATDYKKGALSSFKVSFNDLVEDLKEKNYLTAFSIAAFLAVCVLLYTTSSNCFTPQVKRLNEFKKYQKMTTNNPFKNYGNLLGDKNAKLSVYVYTDYRCPICQTYNVILSRAAIELDNVKFIHKNYPLDSTCNRIVKDEFHKDACLLSRYAIAAEKQNSFWEMNNELFGEQPKDEAEILKIAQKMGLDADKLKIDAYSKLTNEKLFDDIEDGINIDLAGTPAIVVNGKIYTGIQPYYELKEILLKAGAIEKK